MSIIKEIFEPVVESFDSKKGTITLPAHNTGLSRRQKSFLELAMRMAETSDVETNRHGAVVVKGGRVLALGANSWRNRDMLISKGTVSDALTVHAEVDALKRVGNAEGAVVYVARVGKNGNAKFSRPCDACTQRLAEMGVKQVVYTV